MSVVDRSTVPAVVTITNSTSEPVFVPLFKTYLNTEIPAGDSLTINAASSAELIYYMDHVKIDGVTVSVDEAV